MAWHKVRTVNGKQETMSWLRASDAVVGIGDWLEHNGILALVSGVRYSPRVMLDLRAVDGVTISLQAELAPNHLRGWWGEVNLPKGWRMAEKPKDDSESEQGWQD